MKIKVIILVADRPTFDPNKIESNWANIISDEENAQEIERAIDEIIKYDFQNIYKKVKQ